MRTVVKIAFKEGNSVLMFDGFGNMYLGETNLKINEGDHGLIETLPKVSLVKKLDSLDLFKKYRPPKDRSFSAHQREVEFRQDVK